MSLTDGTSLRLQRLAVLRPVVVLAVAAMALAAEAAVRPITVVVLVGALGAIALSAARPQVALALFLISIPLEYGWQINGSESLTVTKLAGGLCFAGFALFAWRTRLAIRLDRTHLLIVALLCVSLASTAQADDQGAAVSTTIRYLSWAVLFLVLTQFAGQWVTVRRLVWALTLSAAVAGVWGSFDFLLGVTSLATLPFGQQNDYAFVLASFLPLGLWLVTTARGGPRVLAVLACACTLAGIVLSLSRGAWLATAAAVGFYLLAHRRQARVLVALALAGTTVIAVFVAVDPGRIREGARAKQAVAQQNVDSRLVLWRGAVRLAGDHPLLGIGPGNFGDHYYEISGAPAGTPPLTAAHETYLEVAAELGVPGLVLFVAVLWVAMTRLNLTIRRRAGPEQFAPFVRMALVAVLVGFLTASEQFFAPVWVVLGFATLLWLEQPSASST